MYPESIHNMIQQRELLTFPLQDGVRVFAVWRATLVMGSIFLFEMSPCLLLLHTNKKNLEVGREGWGVL